VITDVKMPGMDGEEFLAEVRARPGAPPVVMITGHGDIAMAVREASDLRRKLTLFSPGEDGRFGMVGRSRAMKDVYAQSGRARGAFTGAVGEREGKLATASGGTLLLDEIETISPRAQVQLLRERAEDVALLISHFLRLSADRNGIPVPGITEEPLVAMIHHRWPGSAW
jgi:DNA-binding NtrC family response regulator